MSKKFVEYISNDQFRENVKIQLPVLVINGRTEGPTIFLCAAQHGRELHGFAALSCVYEAINPEEVAGRIIMMPVMNPLGVRMRNQDFPTERARYMSTYRSDFRHDMDVSWLEGEDAESVQSPVAQKIYQTYVRQSDIVVDIHGWRSGSIAWADEPELLKFMDAALRLTLIGKQKEPHCTLTRRARAEGKIVHSAEFQPQDYLHAGTMSTACRFIRNLLKIYGLIPGAPEITEERYHLTDRNVFVKTPATGLVVPFYQDQEIVPAGAEYLRLISLDTGLTIWSYCTEETMMNIYSARYYLGEGIEGTSYVEPGMLIGHLNKVRRFNSAAGTFEELQS